MIKIEDHILESLAVHMLPPNGDRRTYGKPKRDYDHSDHGNSSNHPHDEKGGHYHDWDGSKRGSAYVFKGTDTADAITVLCTIGIVCIVAGEVLGLEWQMTFV